MQKTIASPPPFILLAELLALCISYWQLLRRGRVCWCGLALIRAAHRDDEAAPPALLKAQRKSRVTPLERIIFFIFC